RGPGRGVGRPDRVVRTPRRPRRVAGRALGGPPQERTAASVRVGRLPAAHRGWQTGPLRSPRVGPIMRDTINIWVAGARPNTLPAALAPVLAGAAVPAFSGVYDWPLALLCFIVALGLQIG